MLILFNKVGQREAFTQLVKTRTKTESEYEALLNEEANNAEQCDEIRTNC